ncbi:hypothetical protein Tco_0681450 [Tanacetum coccineum]|uniref:Uncharacterized protein n=1 Tax=Tanacetum coccineum TaxID=301880 RepID=A0ABQ4XPY9_9ASTR
MRGPLSEVASDGLRDAVTVIYLLFTHLSRLRIAHSISSRSLDGSLALSVDLRMIWFQELGGVEYGRTIRRVGRLLEHNNTKGVAANHYHTLAQAAAIADYARMHACMAYMQRGSGWVAIQRAATLLIVVQPTTRYTLDEAIAPRRLDIRMHTRTTHGLYHACRALAMQSRDDEGNDGAEGSIHS